MRAGLEKRLSMWSSLLDLDCDRIRVFGGLKLIAFLSRIFAICGRFLLRLHRASDTEKPKD